MRPISPLLRSKLVAGLQREARDLSLADALVQATEMLKLLDRCGLDVVLPGWVPVNDDVPQNVVRPVRRPTWEDLARTLPSDYEERKPWLPYDA